MFTDAVRDATVLVLLRFRYRLREETEEFAEEIVLAAFERRENGPRGSNLTRRGVTSPTLRAPKANISTRGERRPYRAGARFAAA